MSDPKLRIRRNFTRPSTALVAPFREVPTGPVVDAMGRRGALDHDVRPITKANRFYGTALTVWTVPRDNLAAYAALAVAKPGDVLVIATGGADETSILGDIIIGMARNAGIVAAVTDGLVRDVAGLESVGIPVFARGLSPNSPFKNGPGEVGGTIALGRVTISAGDLVIGDVDGVIVVAQRELGATAERLQAILAKERMMEGVVGSGATQPDWLAAMLAGADVEHLD